MVKKHEILQNIRIEKLIFGGSGLATAPDGRRIIISGGAIPDAIVDLRITKSKKNHLEAQILRTVKKSPLEQPIPPEWQLYGGCKWLPIPYAKQLQIKEQQIREAFYPLHLTPSPSSLDKLGIGSKREGNLVNSPSLKEKGSGDEGVFHLIIASPESEHYRNKVEFSWGKYISDREGVHDEYRFGFHAPGQFDRIENCRYCVLADDTVNAIFREIDTLARESGFPTYDPKTGVGFWRHLVVRRAKKTGETMLIFSVNGLYDSPLPSSQTQGSEAKGSVAIQEQQMESSKKTGLLRSSQGQTQKLFSKMVDVLTEKFPQIVSIFFLENTGRADIVQGNPILIFGKPSITEELLGYTFEIQPKSFFQVNTLGAERLYGEVINHIRPREQDFSSSLTGTEGLARNDVSPSTNQPTSQPILLDLYAGTGTIGILLSKYFSKVYSVELVASASEDGKKNAERNSVTNVEFVNAKVEDFAKEFADNKKQADAIVLDPPRDGLHPSAIPHILSFGAKEIIYVSCNPATLVRDLQALTSSPSLLLKEKGENQKNSSSLKERGLGGEVYHLTDVTPVDMFPHTHHIETVVRLERI